MGVILGLKPKDFLKRISFLKRNIFNHCFLLKAVDPKAESISVSGNFASLYFWIYVAVPLKFTMQYLREKNLSI